MFAHATNTASPSLVDSLSLLAARLRAALAGALAANRVYHQLASLSTTQLAARGLVREDIGRMTLQALKHASNY